MISVTGTTREYILQPTLLEKHRTTLEWLSTTAFWKGELAFFQHMLDSYAGVLSSIEDKQRIGHCQSLILYYNAEVLEGMRKKLRDHESKLAQMLERKDELNTSYFAEHDSVMDEAKSFSSQFAELKKEVIEMIDKAKAIHDERQ